MQNNTGDLVFDSSKATEIGNRLIESIKESHRKTITDTLASVGHQLFLQGVEMKEDYELVAGKVTKEVYITEPSLEEAINVLQKHLSEDKSEGSLYSELFTLIASRIYEQFKINSLHTGEEFKKVMTRCDLATEKIIEDLIKQ